MPKTSLIVAAALLCATPALTPAVAGTVDVTVGNIRNARGHIDVQLCDRSHFLKDDGCALHARAPAQAGSVVVHVTGVPPGTYAAEVYHDENDNEVADRNLLGIPTEGIGFSRDASPGLSGPSFDSAAFQVGRSGGAIRLALWYLL